MMSKTRTMTMTTIMMQEYSSKSSGVQPVLLVFVGPARDFKRHVNTALVLQGIKYFAIAARYFVTSLPLLGISYVISYLAIAWY